MTSDSKHSHLISGKGNGGKRSSASSCCRFSWLKSLTTCWRFGYKNSERASQSLCHRKLIELPSKWFLETQVSHVVQDGSFPTWFAGVLSREDAEEILKEKELGCFLIRLSDKATGYILSYTGRDRCRHFLINQSDTGHFVVCGATKGHDTVSNLIQHYRTNLIMPYEEYLTSPCFEAPADRTYDVIQHMSPAETRTTVDRNSEQLPSLKSKTMLEEAPPLARRGRHHETGLPGDPNRMLYAQLRKKPTKNLRSSQQHILKDCSPGPATSSVAGCDTPDQTAAKCRPLSAPEYSLFDSVALTSGPGFSPKTTKEPGPDKIVPCRRVQNRYSSDDLNDETIYFLAGKPGSPHSACIDTTSYTPHYHSAKIHTEAFRDSLPDDDIYEIIPSIEHTNLFPHL
ncbi:SH2 domain-containing protein 7-like [Syngnathoides biaculeatus]|uniref:SH2 domain-containing protein 7-like n=1 Tax=Syngnathoides biaculeatus TaxID=300417 RepID=UPI002ADE2D28|nr:SH2 domain-containing protein 7-like [Syngnathoides biaculeatus]XP_061678742.1 SH2 domain-containing protein 7-like [Syngnathoides biaculeatus]XP_061678743.1 SH2 domain-containing protein 7-like [Syngnathoides biaculeatus]XP_061678744.1 SH2 domain-containing protein 7-like [Syngnathoides biaculeatus]